MAKRRQKPKKARKPNQRNAKRSARHRTMNGGAGKGGALPPPSAADVRALEARRLFDAGNFSQAEDLCRDILRSHPRTVEALQVLGLIAFKAGVLDDAEYFLHQAVAIRPGDPAARTNLGLVLAAGGKPEAAVNEYRQALAVREDFPVALNNLANALAGLGRRDEAAGLLRDALAKSPENSALWYNLGTLYQDLMRTGEAADCFVKCLDLQPGHVGALVNRAICMNSLGNAGEALDCSDRAIALQPDLAEAHNSRGTALARLGRIAEAEEAFNRALALKPDFAEAQENLGNILSQQNRPQAALDFFSRASMASAEDANLLVSRAHRQLHACVWEGLDDLTRRAVAGVMERGEAASPFAFLTLETTAAEQYACARNWVAREIRTPSGIKTGMAIPAAVSSGRLTLGYLSCDFQEHAVTSLIAELIEKHDREQFRVLGFSYGPDDASPMRERLRRGFDDFIDLHPLSATEAARVIREHGVDILVDLKGHTEGARPEICALRPAPIRVRWLGHPGTMGCDWIDFILVDAFVVPPAQQDCYSENLVHLPGCYQANDRQRKVADAAPTRGVCGLPQTGFVFCCFNTAYKITPRVFEEWMRVLRAVDGSVLWLLESNPDMAANLGREAAVRGVDPERLVFCPRIPRPEHLARYRVADLFLDTFTVNACATASDALWAGCPVLTCAGETFASRAAGSILRAAGLADLVTASVEEYVELAIRLAADAAELAAIRERVRNCREHSPLFDSTGSVRNLEAAYRKMVEPDG